MSHQYCTEGGGRGGGGGSGFPWEAVVDVRVEGKIQILLLLFSR